MDGWEVLDQADELRRRGQAFALATVVWRQGPSSGQQGSRAIITASGELQRLDRRGVRGAGRDPRGPAGDRRGHAAPAAARHPGPVRRGGPGRDDRGADLLPERGRAGGLHRAGAARAAPGHRRPLADGADAGRAGRARSAGAPTLVDGAGLLGGRRRRALDGRGRDPGSRRRGGGRAGGRRPARLPRPGRVASPRRGGARLPGRPGRARDQLDRVQVPAGLDLGRTSHREIAVAILAELVQLRAAGAAGGAAPPARLRRQPGAGHRPGLRDDRRGRPGQPPAGARRHHLLLLQRRLPQRSSSQDPAAYLERETRC